MHALINEVVELLAHSIDKRITIKKKLLAHMPITQGDSTQLQNALLNLALNARDAMPKSGDILFATELITLDEEYCKNETEFGQRIVNSCYTLSLMVGVTVYDTTLGTTVGNLGWEEVRFPRPVFHGDTLRFETEIKEKRESKSRPKNGIVTFIHRAYNQDDDLVATCIRIGLMLKRSQP